MNVITATDRWLNDWVALDDGMLMLRSRRKAAKHGRPGKHKALWQRGIPLPAGAQY